MSPAVLFKQYSRVLLHYEIIMVVLGILALLLSCNRLLIVTAQIEMRTVLRISCENDSGVSAFLRRSRIGMNARISYCSEL